jgi:hypothetical protein
VVIAVIAVRVVEPVVHDVVDVVAVRYRLVPTLGAVLMGQIVAGGGLCVPSRMLVVDIKSMFVDVVVVRVVQMPVVQIVDVVAVAHGHVPAALTVRMRVILMDFTGHDFHLIADATSHNSHGAPASGA